MKRSDNETKRLVDHQTPGSFRTTKKQTTTTSDATSKATQKNIQTNSTCSARSITMATRLLPLLHLSRSTVFLSSLVG